jgi:putative aldouronate transport system substrate-binding protein
MKKFKISVLGIALSTVSILSLTACSSGQSEETKDVKEGFTLLSPDHSADHPKNKDLWMWKEYEKKNGVPITWQETKDINEKKNLLLSESKLPDAFYQVYWTSDELVKYGKQGLFQPIEDMISEHAPNFQKLMDENPEIKKSITAPDGHIYFLPELSIDPQIMGLTFRYYINQEWLDNLGLEVPRTTEELKTVLTEFVTKDPNGNGKADEQGWYMNSGELPNSFEKLLMAAYGMGTGGRTGIETSVYYESDGSLQLTLNSEKMREVWQYESDLYKNGLMSKNSFSGADSDKWRADASNNTVGLWSWVSPEYIGGSVQDKYTPINVLEGPTGDKSLVINGPVGTSGLVITKDCENPEKLLEWVDYWYSQEGSNFGYLGEKGVTYNEVNGKKVYTDEILNYEKGAQLGAYQYLDNVYGGGYPYSNPSQADRDTAQGLEPITYDDFTEDVMPEKMLSPVMPTPEESQQLSTIMTDMDNYVEQSRVKFVTGEWNFTSDWDKYVEQLQKIGSDKLLEIRRAQYKRYEEG